MFIDVAKIKIKAGDGGNGAVAFIEKYMLPQGGPDGGDGGQTAAVILSSRWIPNLSTLADFRYKRKYLAPNGEMEEKPL